MGVSKTSDRSQIKIKMPNPSRETPASYWAPNQDLKDIAALCTFKMKIGSQKLGHRCSLHLQIKIDRKKYGNGFIKDQWPYPNRDQDAQPKSGTSSILQSPKWGLKGHGCSMHLQNCDRGPKFRSWLYQTPVTISKSRSRFQTPVSHLQHPSKSQIRT